ncbi:MAG: putative N-acetyltransferase [Pseudonocardiales bacterium]|nr:putative N-acetyltransferase [Pseudonocardiales bacterium]
MTDIDVVNPVPVDEVQPWLASMATTFLSDPESDIFQRQVEAWRREWYPDRTWGARAHGRWVATLATEARTVTVPGPEGTTRDVVADALTAVTVNATHRRRGVLTRMLTESLAAAKNRGEPFSVLIAAEWPIYGRFGYAPATQVSSYTLFPRLRPDLLTPAETGRVRQVDPSDLDKVAADVFDRARRLRVGQVDRPGAWWPRRLGLDGYRPINHGNAPNYFVHDGPDGPDGVLWWAATRDFELNGDLGAISVGNLTAASDHAYRNLFAYLAGIDVIGEIALDRRPVDEPIQWLLSDGRALRHTGLLDDVWLRLLDVPAALSARAYARPGRLVLDVVDADIGGYAAGRYTLDATEDSAECRPTSESADLRISQRALASTYLGGFTLRQQAIAGGVEELTAGAAARADAMFATALAPWNATGF